MIQQLFFAYFGCAIVILSILVISMKNPVHSVLWMLLLFFHIASLYLFLNAEFMAAMQVIVYAGGNRFISAWPTALTFAAGLLAVIILSVRSFVAAPPGIFTIDFIKKETNAKALGTLLYTDYLYPFEVASLILLVAIVGAIVLAKRRIKS
jgi:NADH-quinone oxidoreductase subunit J